MVQWVEDPKVYIANALSPAQVSAVVLNEQDSTALVVVPDKQLSLAIGKEGQNARLAAKLTAWRIDIKSVSVYETEKAKQAVSTAARYFNRHKGIRGYRPYRKLMIYENAQINAHYYPGDPQKTWDDIGMVWPEGTLGVALAHLKIGERR